MRTIRLKWQLLASIVLVAIVFMNISCGGRNVTVKWESVQQSETSNNFKLKVYIENSGSMDGYMCDGSELKDAVYSYASSLSSYADTTELNYINSAIISYGKDIKSFIKELNPLKFAQAGGNRSNSDIAEMFERILSKTDENTISIFVSDCILDVPNGNATDFFENRSIDIRNAFTKYLHKFNDLGVEVFRLESSFKGRYYYSHGSEYLQDVKRPYYMWVIGNKNILAYLNEKVPFSEIKHGVKNYFAFSTNSVLPFEITNKMGIAKKNECVCTKNRNGDNEMLIKANLNSTLQRSDVLCSTSNYVTLTSNIRISNITEVANSPYSHIINVVIMNGDKNFAERVLLKPLYAPFWLDEANDDSGKDIRKNMEKTTGIKYLIQGIADAYKKEQKLGEFKFVISNR